jgi:tripartite-type tricarboxylate transporter receptor subunit TctC
MFNKLFIATLAALLALTAGAAAQTFPSRPITMVIPFAAGGPTDVLGRVVGARMSDILGQQVVIENVGGGGGQTGSRRVATRSSLAPWAPTHRDRHSIRSPSTTP